MNTARPHRELIIGVTPGLRPDGRLVVGLCRGGALGVLDLGRDAGRARAELALVEERYPGDYGVRLTGAAAVDPVDLSHRVTTVVVDDLGLLPRHQGAGRRFLVEVTSPGEAVAAVDAGADGLVAKGCEAGGRVGDDTAFVLLQRLLGTVDVPVWSQGGIGPHTAAAAVAGGARGVVLDAQLALARESTFVAAARRAVAALDGSETTIVAGHRLYTPPGRPSPAPNAPAAQVHARLGADDLRTELLPVGQDAAFAAALAGRHKTAGGIVGAVRAAVEGHASLAATLRPLAPGAGVAAARGTAHPIVRWSADAGDDPVAAAGAVAQAGGLPLLALGDRSPAEIRTLLTETRAQVDGRPWGVGIVGLVPPDRREEQLAAVRAARPPVALVAGGGPTPVASLEDEGIATYLHVPAPGLLDRLLDEGARRFLFAGRECGGHAGPLTCFTLWERQVERLLAVDNLDGVEVLFAGGLQDARGVAMIAALAAPLAARGAALGVVLVDDVDAGPDVSAGAETLAERHAAVSEGGSRRVADVVAGDTRPAARPAPLDVAVIGTAGVFPGAAGVDRLWANVVGGVDAAGAGLPPVPLDPPRDGTGPAEVRAAPPGRLLSLHVAAAALADAGYAERPFDRTRAAVVFGAADDGGASGEGDVAGSVAARLDLGGAGVTVGAAGGASMAALHLACHELTAGTSDVVLCGGTEARADIDGRRPWAGVHAGVGTDADADADGAPAPVHGGRVPGDGAGCVVLKRLVDAERDGDRILAVLEAVATAGTGRPGESAARRGAGRDRALAQAYTRAGISPASVGLVEAHVTGGRDGAPTAALAPDAAHRAGAGAATLTSVCSLIGDTGCAAGVAGLVATVHAVHRGVLPPAIGVAAPTPGGADNGGPGPVVVGDVARPWVADERRAAVCALGAGGASFHALLRSYGPADEPTHGVDEWPAELVLLRGATRTDRSAILGELEALLDTNDAAGRPWRLRDVARTAAQGRRDDPVQVALVADDLDDLRAKVARARDGAPGSAVALAPADGGTGPAGDDPAGRVGFLFPGQGSARAHMLRDLFVAFPWLRRYLDLAGHDLTDRMFPPRAPGAAAGGAAGLTDPRVAQPALGVAELAVHALLGACGVRPDVVGGHGYGELAALVVAGALDERDLVALSRARGDAVVEAQPGDAGPMTAVRATAAEVETVLERWPAVVVAVDDAPDRCMIAGPTAEVEAAVTQLGRLGHATRSSAVAGVCHTPRLSAASWALADRLADIDVVPPSLPVWSNVSAAPYPVGPDQIRRRLADQISAPVAFRRQVEAMHEAGVRTFVEVGPGGALTRLVQRTLGDRPYATVTCDAGDEHGIRRFLRALAGLVAAGVPVEPDVLFTGRDAVVIDPAATPRPAPYLLAGGYVRERDGTPVTGPRSPAAHVDAPVHLVPGSAPAVMPPAVTPPAVTPGGGAAAPAVPDPDPQVAVAEYLRNMRQVVGAGRDVVMALLGSGEVGPTGDPPAPGPAGHDVAAVAREEDAGAATVEEEAVPLTAEEDAVPAAGPHADTDPAIGGGADVWDVVESYGGPATPGVAEPAARVDPAGDDPAAGGTGIAGTTDGPGAPTAHAPAAPVAGASTEPHDTAPSPVVPAEPGADDSARPARYVPVLADVPPARSVRALVGLPVAVLGDDGTGIGPALCEALAVEGAAATLVLAGEELPAGSPCVVDLGALTATGDGTAAVLDQFERLRAAAQRGAREIVVVTGLGGDFAHGGPATVGAGAADGAGDPAAGEGPADDDPAPGERPADAVPATPGPVTVPADATLLTAGAAAQGMAKGLDREMPVTRTRVVDVDPRGEEGAVAEQLVAELRCTDAPGEVGRSGGRRRTVVAVRRDLDPAVGEAGVPLGPDSVVVVTGGARGMGAKVAAGIARAHGCGIELIARSPVPPTHEPADLACCEDAASIREAIIRRGELRRPEEIEAACRRVLAEREVRRSLGEISTHAAFVGYRRVDVRDLPALGGALDEIRRERGGLDGVIHAIGAREDGLVRDKTTESFARVFDTKVHAARLLSEAVADDGFLILLASLAGVFGHAGQIDRGAADSCLDAIARSRGGAGGRILAVDWGPWAGTGGAGAHRPPGSGLIEPAEGVAVLLDELAHGLPEPQIVVTRGDRRPSTADVDDGDARSVVDGGLGVRVAQP